MLFMIALGVTTAGFAQRTQVHEEHQTLKKKKTTTTVTKQSKDSLTRDSAPILNDNGTTNSTGTIEGRSSTGRTADDSVTTYTVKKRKTTIKTVPNTSKKPN